MVAAKHTSLVQSNKCHSSVFKSRRKVLRCSDDLQWHKNEFHTKGELTRHATLRIHFT